MRCLEMFLNLKLLNDYELCYLAKCRNVFYIFEHGIDSQTTCFIFSNASNRLLISNTSQYERSPVTIAQLLLTIVTEFLIQMRPLNIKLCVVSSYF